MNSKIFLVTEKLDSRSICFSCQSYPCKKLFNNWFIDLLEKLRPGKFFHLKDCPEFDKVILREYRGNIKAEIYKLITEMRTVDLPNEDYLIIVHSFLDDLERWMEKL